MGLRLVALLLLFQAIAVQCVIDTTAKQLSFNPDGTFKIALFADLHYGEHPDKDAKSDKVQSDILAVEKPDFVVFTGDQASGWFGGKNNESGWYAKTWAQATQPVQQAETPYALTLGNHDDEADLDRRGVLQLDIDTSSGLSLTKQGPLHVTGASNYYIDILDTSSANQAPAARLWLLDSMSRGCGNDTSGWGCVGADVVQWVTETAATLPPVPSLAFIHIPIPQFVTLWNERPTNGSKGEDVACPLVDTGVIAAAAPAGIQVLFSGHDHNNNYHGYIEQGLMLGFTRKTGYGSYGPLGLRGATIIQLELGRDADKAAMWVRQEDGSAVVLQPSPPKKQVQEACKAIQLDAMPQEWKRSQQSEGPGSGQEVIGIGVLGGLLLGAVVLVKTSFETVRGRAVYDRTSSAEI